MASTKSSVGKSILFSFFTVLLFYLLCTVIGIILVLIYTLLKLIPVVGDLLDIFFSARGDGPELAIPYLYFILSYFLSISIIDRIVKDIPTRKLTFVISGYALIIINIIFLILNAIGGGSWGLNIGYIIAGIAFIFKSWKYKT